MHIYEVKAYEPATGDISYRAHFFMIGDAYSFYKRQLEERGLRALALSYIIEEVQQGKFVHQHLKDNYRIAIMRLPVE